MSSSGDGGGERYPPTFPACYCQVWKSAVSATSSPVWSPSPWYAASTLQVIVNDAAEETGVASFDIVTVATGEGDASFDDPDRPPARRDAPLPMIRHYETHLVALFYDIVECCLEKVPEATVNEALAPAVQAPCGDCNTVWLKFKQHCSFSDYPGLREALTKKHCAHTREDGVEVDDIFALLEAGCDLGRASIGIITNPLHPLIRGGVDVAGLFTLQDIKAHQLIGMYSGALLPNKVLNPFVESLAYEDQKRVWTYDYEAPRLPPKLGDHTFFAASVRNAMGSTNDFHGIQDDATLKMIGMLFGGLIPVLLLAARSDIPAVSAAARHEFPPTPQDPFCFCRKLRLCSTMAPNGMTPSVHLMFGQKTFSVRNDDPRQMIWIWQHFSITRTAGSPGTGGKLSQTQAHRSSTPTRVQENRHILQAATRQNVYTSRTQHTAYYLSI
jgi:hypothetical protein